MAEGFEGYHVPQQSRRDKLRVFVTQNQQGLVEPLLPLYAPSSFVSSDLISCADQQGHNFHQHNQASKPNLGSNLMMRFMNGSASSSVSRNSFSSVSHHAYLNPESSLPPLNQGAIQVIGDSTFVYNGQNNLRGFDQSYNNDGENEISTMFKHEPLFLSLSSQKQGNLPLGLNLDRYGTCGDKVSGVGGGGCVIPGLVGGGSASGPFTGYASILKDSRFLEPAQKLLEETCDAGGRGVCAEKVVVAADASLMEPPLDGFSEDPLGGDHGGEARKKSRLLTMLDEVYRRYRQYYQQMHAVVTSFEYVSGLSNAAPYASLAIKAMSKHFRSLKNAITDQLQFTNKAHFHVSNSDRDPHSQRSGFLEHQQPVWRPQRGLPERAVTVLRAWLYEHFLHPYPTDTDKLMLAKQTGLSRSQVSNWFINARVRLWKPMVEEIHMLETQQAQKDSQKEEHYMNKSSNHFPSDNHSLVSENPSTSTEKFQSAPYKHTINELPNIPVGVSMDTSASNSVSLTLGLYQNHGIGLAEPFPLSAAQRFGLALETSNEGYVMSGLESQSRHFGRDVIGGQMLHDFVG